MKIKRLRTAVCTAVLVASVAGPLVAQEPARISEERRTFTTYPFSEPNPIPILPRDARLYPYHSFEGYAHDPVEQDWTVVHLENDYIEVWVLPEVGGKVWGARVKESGHEFIYRNEVMKFRNIALRGPWTSGGIEFNFGIIGHTPATATPVDYLLRENDDGSVSCFVGTMDLPSRTMWRVEIRLPADRAYFETNALWYNPTPLEQPYYNWMTGAGFAQDDLELAIPGDTYLTHPGMARDWPTDPAGRDLSLYRNNTFGDNKSYHVVGELNDFFGGYFVDEDYGYGHWARHEDLPGQKQWLWASSRLGGIWEDLLTDTDGQYAEFQAGRLLVQYSPDGSLNPITQAGFDPLSSSRWTETWFPVEGLGGLTDASRDGAMALHLEDARLQIAAHAFGDVLDTLFVWVNGELVTAEPVSLRTLEPVRTSVPVPVGARYRVALPALDLDYDSDPSDRLLARPYRTDPAAAAEVPEVTGLAFEAAELSEAREYTRARALYEEVVRREPWHRDGRLGLADLAFRSGLYPDALAHVNRVLQLDAYDAEANFLAGIAYRALDQHVDAHDAFGWAARSMAFRSAAYVELANLMIEEESWSEAERYARLALDFDRTSVPAHRALAVIGRAAARPTLTDEAIEALLAIDPLHHFAMVERGLAERGGPSMASISRSEFAEQAAFEVAVKYQSWGRTGDALSVLDALDRPGTLARVWQAWLRDDPRSLGAPALAFTFPFRRESLEVLAWAVEQSEEWGWRYLLALNLWARDRVPEAAELLTTLGDEPDYAPVYVARGLLLQAEHGTDPGPDLRRAAELAPESRIVRIAEVQFLLSEGRWEEALSRSREARTAFATDFNLALLEVLALNELGRGREALDILANVRVLPSEHARDSHRLYEQAQLMVALDAFDRGALSEAQAHALAALEWPEHLGQGRPYRPEERMSRYLLAEIESALGNRDAAEREFARVVDASAPLGGAVTRLDALGIFALYSPDGMERIRERAADLLSREAPEATALGRFAQALASEDVPGALSGLRASGLLGDDLTGRLLARILSAH